MYSGIFESYYFNVVKGYLGQVTNTVNVTGVDYLGIHFNKLLYLKSGSTDIAGPRYATIVSRPTPLMPIATVGVALLTQIGGTVVTGDNRMRITLTNTSASPTIMQKSLEIVVLLPLGVTLKTNPIS